jgi:hypothetical protein
MAMPTDELAPLAFLIGTWRGEGSGSFPGIDEFSYGEEMSFVDVGEPYLVYTQRTWSLDDEQPIHLEAGFWRPRAGGGIEATLASPLGTEIEIGAVTGGRIEMMTQSVDRAPSAKDVARVERSLHVRGDQLTYDLRMAATGHPITHHTHAELERVG